MNLLPFLGGILKLPFSLAQHLSSLAVSEQNHEAQVSPVNRECPHLENRSCNPVALEVAVKKFSLVGYVVCNTIPFRAKPSVLVTKKQNNVGDKLFL